MASGNRDLSFHHGKVGCPEPGDHAGRHDQHGNVEMLLEHFTGFDRDFVSAVHQDGAGTFDVYERHVRHRHRSRRLQRQHPRPYITSRNC